MKIFATLSLMTALISFSAPQQTWAQQTENELLPETFSFTTSLKDKDRSIRTSAVKPVTFNGQKMDSALPLFKTAEKYFNQSNSNSAGSTSTSLQAIYQVYMQHGETTYYLPHQLVSAVQRTIQAAFIKNARKSYFHVLPSTPENFIESFLQWNKFEASAKAYTDFAKEMSTVVNSDITPQDFQTYSLATPEGNYCNPGEFAYHLTMIPGRQYPRSDSVFYKMIVLVNLTDYCGEN